MEEPRIYVDFNEILEKDLVMLSQHDIKKDSAGNDIRLFEGLRIKIYMDDFNLSNERDNLLAEGTVEKNTYESWSIVKWNCRIGEKGIYNESDIK